MYILNPLKYLIFLFCSAFPLASIFDPLTEDITNSYVFYVSPCCHSHSSRVLTNKKLPQNNPRKSPKPNQNSKAPMPFLEKALSPKDVTSPIMCVDRKVCTILFPGKEELLK